MKSFVRKLLGPLLLATAVFPASRSSAAVDMFLKLADSQGTTLIEGESLDKQHPKEIVISSFSQGVSVPISGPIGGGDVPSESLSLNFTKIEWRYTPQKADGSPDAPVIATWDLAANKP